MSINFIDYLKDIFSGEHKMARLADIIVKKASENTAIIEQVLGIKKDLV